MSSLRFLPFLLLAGTALSCRSLSTPPISPELLTRTWRVTSLTEQVGQASPTNLLQAGSPCWNDNLYQLQPRGIYTLREGLTKCNAEDPASRSGHWELTPSSRYLRATIIFGPPSAGAETRLQGQIESLTTRQLVLVQADTMQGVITRTRTTLQAQ